MIKLARLSVDDVVLDTCTGSGGFLMESMEKMISLAKGDEKKIDSIKENQLIGFEVDPVLFSLACSNMFLHGDGRTNLLFRSSLLSDESGAIMNSSNEDLLKFIRGKNQPSALLILLMRATILLSLRNRQLIILSQMACLLLLCRHLRLQKTQRRGGQPKSC